MTVVELSEKETIAALLRRNARAHVYEIGDLDDFDWPHTRWFGWERDGRLEELVLLYTEPDVPVLLAIAEEPLEAINDAAARDPGYVAGRPLRARDRPVARDPRRALRDRGPRRRI